MPIIKNGDVEIHYREAGSGPPLLVIPGGGLNATIAGLADHAINPLEDLSDAYRVIALDLRHANEGLGKGPLEIERPWDAFTDDQLFLMDHLGIDRFMVLGSCIAGPMIWNLLRLAGESVVSAVLVHPSGFSSAVPDIYVRNNMKNWAPGLCAQNLGVTMEMAAAYLDNMYTKRADFVFTVDRDFVRACQTPVLILPDDIPSHPYGTAMETAMLAPNAQVSLYPWKENDRKIALALRHVRDFLVVNAAGMMAGVE